MTKKLHKTFYVFALIVMCAMSAFFFSACGKISVEKVELDVTAKTIEIGSTFKLNATITPNNATNTKLHWSSTSESVAIVDGDGNVTGLSAGDTNIIVKTDDGNKIATCSVTVVPATIKVESVSLSETTKELAKGDSFTLVATVNPSDADNKNVSWSSSNANVVTVDNGVVTAVNTGTATITVATVDGGKTAECIVTVPVVQATSITLSADGLSQGLISMWANDQPITIKATVLPANSTQTELVWSSSNEQIATVNNGVISPVAGAKGETIITVKCADNDNIVATCTVNVKIHVESIAFTQDSIEMMRYTLVNPLDMLVFTPANASNKTVTFTSVGGNANIITENGVVNIYALREGVSTITATTEDGEKTATLLVTVHTPVKTLSLNLTQAEITTSSIQLVATAKDKDSKVMTEPEIIWESSDTSLLTVDENGKVSPQGGTGTATITVRAKYTFWNANATCTFTVKNAYVLIEGKDTEYATFEQALEESQNSSTLILHGLVSVIQNNLTISNKKLTIKGFNDYPASANHGPVGLIAKGEEISNILDFLVIENNSDITFQDLTLDGNGALSNVRVLKVDSSNLVLKNVEITNGKFTNRTDAYGNGLMLTGTTTANLVDSYIFGNSFTLDGVDNEDLKDSNPVMYYSQDLFMGSQTLVTIQDSTIEYACKDADEYTREGGSYVIVKSAKDNYINKSYIKNLFLNNTRDLTMKQPAAKLIYYGGKITNLLVLVNKYEGVTKIKYSPNYMYTGDSYTANSIPAGY